jgi:hypothetical protein
MNPTEITLELRATAPRAPEALRQRVAAIAADEPERRGSLLRLPAAPRRHRTAFALAAVLAVAVGSALVAGLLGSGSHKSATQRFDSELSLPATSTTSSSGGGSDSAGAIRGIHKAAGASAGAKLQRQKAPAASRFNPATIPPSLRLQDYQVYLGVRVKDEDALSKATVQAMRWTRAFGGYVAHVSYGTAGSKNGESQLVLRVPVTKVQDAIQKLSSLGTLQSQHVSVTDLQDQVNAQSKRIIVLSRRIQAIVKRLQAGGLSVDQEAQLRAELAADRAELGAVTQAKSATVRRGRLSRIELELTTHKSSVAAPPSKPGRFGQALHDAGRILAAEAAIVLYALIVVGPLALLALAAWLAARAGRRRQSERLLARS